MSVKNTMDKTMTALEDAKTKCCKVYDFVNNLSVRNKANFDLSIKHGKYSLPIWRYGFGYVKEIRVMPVLMCFIAGLIAVFTAVGIANHSDK